MVHVPAFCDNCGNIFPSGFVFENSVGETMRGNKSQCPLCKQMARVPDGVFNFYENAIEVLEASEATVLELQKLYSIIQKASIEEPTLQEVKQEVAKEVPRLSFLSKYLPQNVKELGVYLSAITALIGGFGINIEVNTNIEIDRSEIHQHFEIDQTNQQFNLRPVLEGDRPFQLPEKKIGRNEPCPCESGLKYKYCHGK